mmetsp:Transcript_1527/g.3723  ORF Transcript_1527/g.3723 Transcript_1527/m.3723 type:complete len:730 (+) Transcript_1527:914-3103(+)
MLVGGNRTHLEVVVQPFDGRVRKEGKKVPQLDLGDDSGGPHKRLGHHGPRKAHGGVEVSQKDKLGSHVVFQVHLEGGKQESSPPARFLFPTRPAAGSTNTALGIEKERHDVGVALAGYEKMAIEHFRQTGRGDVVPNRPIEVGLGSGAPHRSVRVLCLELLWADKAGNRGTRYHGAGDGDVWGADVVYQNGGCLFCGSSQRNAQDPSRLLISFFERYVAESEPLDHVQPLVPVKEISRLPDRRDAFRPGSVEAPEVGADDLRIEVPVQLVVRSRAQDGPDCAAGTAATDNVRKAVGFHQSLEVAEVVEAHHGSTRKAEGRLSVGVAGSFQEPKELLPVDRRGGRSVAVAAGNRGRGGARRTLLLRCFGSSVDSYWCSRGSCGDADRIVVLVLVLGVRFVIAIAIPIVIVTVVAVAGGGTKIKGRKSDQRPPYLFPFHSRLLPKIGFVRKRRAVWFFVLLSSLAHGLLFRFQSRPGLFQDQGLVRDPAEGFRDLVDEFHDDELGFSRVGLRKQVLVHDPPDVLAGALLQHGQGLYRVLLDQAGLPHVLHELPDEYPVVLVAGLVAGRVLPLVAFLRLVEFCCVLVPLLVAAGQLRHLGSERPVFRVGHDRLDDPDDESDGNVHNKLYADQEVGQGEDRPPQDLPRPGVQPARHDRKESDHQQDPPKGLPQKNTDLPVHQRPLPRKPCPEGFYRRMLDYNPGSRRQPGKKIGHVEELVRTDVAVVVPVEVV